MLGFATGHVLCLTLLVAVQSADFAESLLGSASGRQRANWQQLPGWRPGWQDWSQAADNAVMCSSTAGRCHQDSCF